VDLVSNSIGEDSMATHKTRYIHNTLTGYSPLLHNFDKNRTKDLKSFLELCQEVWKNLEANPDLAENMVCIDPIWISCLQLKVVSSQSE